MTRIWTEVSRTSEGVSITMYGETQDGEPFVRDESWWTWGEFLQMEPKVIDIDETSVLEYGEL